MVGGGFRILDHFFVIIFCWFALFGFRVRDGNNTVPGTCPLRNSTSRRIIATVEVEK